jgi:hypothetical protein
MIFQKNIIDFLKIYLLIFIEKSVTLYTIIQIKFNIYYNWLVKTNLMIYLYKLYTKSLVNS